MSLVYIFSIYFVTQKNYKNTFFFGKVFINVFNVYSKVLDRLIFKDEYENSENILTDSNVGGRREEI